MALGGLLGATGGGAVIGGSIVRLFLDDSEFNAALAKSKGELDATAGTASKFGAITKAAFVAVGVAAVAFAASAVKAATDHQAALAQLSAAAGVNTTAFEQLAEAQVKLTGFTQDETIAAETQVARFKLNADQMNTLIPLVEDFARATGTDAATAATGVSKALLGSSRALKSVGIDFKATGNSATDFNTLVADLQQHVGGSSAAFLGTYAGKLALLGAQYDELKIKIGTALLPVLSTFAGWLTTIMTILPHLGNEIKIIAAAFGAWQVGGLVTDLANMAVGAITAAAGVKGLTVSFLGLELSAGVVGAAILLVGGAIFALDKAVTDASGTQQLLAKQFTFTGEQAAALGYGVDGVTGTLQQLTDAQKLSAKTGRPFADSLNYVKTGVDGVTGSTTGLTDATNAAKTATEDLIQAQLQLAGGLTGVLSAEDAAKTATQALSKARATLTKLTNQGKQGTQAYHQAVQAVTTAEHGSLTAQLSLAGAVLTYKKQLDSGTISQKDAIAQIKTFGHQAGLTRGEISGLIHQILSGVTHIGNLAAGVKTGTDQVKSFGDASKVTNDHVNSAAQGLGKFGNILAGQTSSALDTAKTKVDALGSAVKALPTSKQIAISLNITPNVSGAALSALVDSRINAAIAGLTHP